MSVRYMCVVCSLLMGACFMVLGSFLVMMGCVLVMLGGLFVMMRCFLRHRWIPFMEDSPQSGWRVSPALWNALVAGRFQ